MQKEKSKGPTNCRNYNNLNNFYWKHPKMDLFEKEEVTDGHSGVGQLPRAGAVPLAGEPVTGLVGRGEFLTQVTAKVVAV